MNERHSELTSALLDGELDPRAQLQFLSELTGPEREELERFERYCLIGDAIRGESTVLAVSVASKVHESLVDEPVVLAPSARENSRAWLKPLAGVAVAASVAAVAIFVAPQLMTQPKVDDTPAQVATEVTPAVTKSILVAAGSTSPQPAPAPKDAKGTRWRGLTPDLENRLNRLVIEHHEFGGRTGINGPVPHIGLVSYGAR